MVTNMISSMTKALSTIKQIIPSHLRVQWGIDVPWPVDGSQNVAFWPLKTYPGTQFTAYSLEEIFSTLPLTGTGGDPQ